MKIKSILIGILSLISFVIYGQNRDIEVTHERRSDNSVDFYYTKNVPGTYFIRIEFNNLQNCNDSRIQEQIVKYDSGNLFTLRPYNKEQGISFSYSSIRYLPGNPNPKIDDKIIYALPFGVGKTVKIREASNLNEQYFGSEKPAVWKSFVVHTNEPDTIYSMRRGIVVKMNNKYENDNKFKKVYTSKRNNITIEHPDGTYATYKGFDKNQIFVELGQEVYPHTPLGKLDKFNEDYRFDFNVFYYLENLLEDQKGTLKDRKPKVNFIDPNFFINTESKKIKSGESYEVLFNDDIKLQEFSRREKRNYKKDPSKFR